MYFDGPHQCPHCTCYCNVEDYAEQPAGDDALITYLYCDSCNIGTERLFHRKGKFWSHALETSHDWRKPRALARFLNHLATARTAATDVDVAA